MRADSSGRNDLFLTGVPSLDPWERSRLTRDKACRTPHSRSRFNPGPVLFESDLPVRLS